MLDFQKSLQKLHPHLNLSGVFNTNNKVIEEWLRIRTIQLLKVAPHVGMLISKAIPSAI